MGVIVFFFFFLFKWRVLSQNRSQWMQHRGSMRWTEQPLTATPGGDRLRLRETFECVICFLTWSRCWSRSGRVLIQRRKEKMLLQGPGSEVFSLSLCLRLSVSSSCCCCRRCRRRRCCCFSIPSPSDCLLRVTECPGALVPLALQWRMNGPDAPSTRNPSPPPPPPPPRHRQPARAPFPSLPLPHKRACACPRACVHARAPARVCARRVNECGWRSESSSRSTSSSSLLLSTADYCSLRALIQTNTAAPSSLCEAAAVFHSEATACVCVCVCVCVSDSHRSSEFNTLVCHFFQSPHFMWY